MSLSSKVWINDPGAFGQQLGENMPVSDHMPSHFSLPSAAGPQQLRLVRPVQVKATFFINYILLNNFGKDPLMGLCQVIPTSPPQHGWPLMSRKCTTDLTCRCILARPPTSRCTTSRASSPRPPASRL